MSASVSSNLPENLLKPSPAFKKEAVKTLAAILVFIVVYILLLILALALAAACIYCGVMLVVNVPKWITILIGGGLVGLGVMVCIFLVKFIFDKTKEDLSDSIEITAGDEPALVEFIYSVAEQTGTKKPKRIFISHDVNACVFYNSSFWSMFLPVKKNLKIGLGLVNGINVGEFKAVMAHEFGHFSQRSMKLGSFVYNVNHIIFNMLFKNTGYTNTLQSFANIHGVFSIFAQITAKIVQAIQWVLRQMYKIVNLRYMGLSRQMEFHADLVAATVSGSNNIVSSLKRIELADACFQSTLSTYDKLWKENKRAGNIYEDHRSVLHYFARANKFDIVEGLPVLTKDHGSGPGQRVNIKDQWASHPSTLEREAYLNNFNLQSTINETSAWSLIKNADQLKENLTQHIYRNIDAGKEKIILDNEDFNSVYNTEMELASLPGIFNNYYNDRTIAAFELPENDTVPAGTAFADVFMQEVEQLPGLIKSIESDISILKLIKSGEVTSRTFDFDGVKQHRKKASVNISHLETELSQKKDMLAAADKEMYRFFYYRAVGVSSESAVELKENYNSYFKMRKEADEYLLFLQSFVNLIQSVYQALPNNEIIALIKKIKTEESKLKTQIEIWQQRGAFKNDLVLLKEVNDFIKSDRAYFSGTSYFDHELAQLNTIIQDGWTSINMFVFGMYRLMLEKQASLI